MIDPTIVTLASVPAILAVVNLLKGLGLSGRWSALVAVVLGLGFVAAQNLLDPGTYQIIAEGLILGLGAAGLYDVGASQKVTINEIYEAPDNGLTATVQSVASKE